MLGTIAQDIIGLSLQQIILNNRPANVPVLNLALAAEQIMHTSPEIAAVVSCRYKFIIHVTANSFQRNSASFNVQTVEAYYPD